MNNVQIRKQEIQSAQKLSHLTVGDGAMYDSRDTSTYPLGWADALDAAIQDIINNNVETKWGFAASKILGIGKALGASYDWGGCTRRSARAGQSLDISGIERIDIDLSACNFRNTYFSVPRDSANYKLHGPIVIGDNYDTGTGPKKVNIKIGKIDNNGTDGNFIVVTSREYIEDCSIEINEVVNWSNSQSGGVLTNAGDQQGIVRVDNVSEATGINNLSIKIKNAHSSVNSPTNASSQFIVNISSVAANPINNLYTSVHARDYHGTAIRYNTDDRAAIGDWVNESSSRARIQTTWFQANGVDQEHQAFINDKQRGGVTSFTDKSYYEDRSDLWNPTNYPTIGDNYGSLQLFNCAAVVIKSVFVRARAPIAIGYWDNINTEKYDQNVRIDSQFIDCATLGDIDDHLSISWSGSTFTRMNMGAVKLGYGQHFSARSFRGVTLIDCYTYHNPDDIVPPATEPEEKLQSVLYLQGPTNLSDIHFVFTEDYKSIIDRVQDGEEGDTVRNTYNEPKALITLDQHIGDPETKYTLKNISVTGIKENTNIPKSLNILPGSNVEIINCELKLPDGDNHLLLSNDMLPEGIVNHNFDTEGNYIDHKGDIHPVGIIEEEKIWFYAGTSLAYDDTPHGQQFNQPWLGSTNGYLSKNFNNSSVTEWLQMNLVESSFISNILIKGRADSAEWVETCRIEYSDDNINWVSAGDFNANTDQDTLVKIPLRKKTKHVRIIPLTWNLHKAMRASLEIGSVFDYIDSDVTDVTIPAIVGVNISEGKFLVSEHKDGTFSLAHARNESALGENVHVVLSSNGENHKVAKVDGIYKKDMTVSHGLTSGTAYFVSDTEPGKVQTTPSTFYNMPIIKVISSERSHIEATADYAVVGTTSEQIYDFASNWQTENGNITAEVQSDGSVIITDATDAGSSNYYTLEVSERFLKNGESYTVSFDARAGTVDPATSVSLLFVDDIDSDGDSAAYETVGGVNDNYAITGTYATFSKTFTHDHTGSTRIALVVGTIGAGGEGVAQFANLKIVKN